MRCRPVPASAYTVCQLQIRRSEIGRHTTAQLQGMQTLRIDGRRPVSAHGDFGTFCAYTTAMGIAGLVFSLFSVGYILGVWTACLVFRQPQRAFEDGVPAVLSSTGVIVLGDASRLVERRP